MLYYSCNNAFNTQILQNIEANQALINYYQKYRTADKINTKEAHNEWAQVVSGLPDVNYLQGQCEMNAGIINMLKVIEGLIPNVTSFEELAQKLQEQNIEVSIQSEHPLNEEQYDKNNIITIDIKKPDVRQFSLTWQFTPGHFEIEFPAYARMVYQQKFREALAEKIRISDPANKWPYLMLYAAFGATAQELLDLIQNGQLAYNALLLLPTETPEGRITMTEGIIQAMITEQDQKRLDMYKEIIFSIQKNLPRDRYILERFFEAVLSSFTPYLVTVQKQLLEQTDDKGKTAYISTILNKSFLPTDELYKRIVKTLPTIEDKYSIISIILAKPLPTDAVGKNFFRTIYNEWISKNLDEINVNEKTELMAQIVENPIPTDEFSKELFEPLYHWVGRTLPTTQNEHAMQNLIISILTNFLPINEIGQILYEAVIKALPTIQMDFLKMSTIIKILEKPPTNKFEALYQYVSDTLPTIREDYDKNLIIDFILEKPLPMDKFGTALLKPLYNWIANTLPTFQKDDEKVKVIYHILGKTIPTDEFGKELFKSLYAGIVNTLTTIQGEHYKNKLSRYIYEKKPTEKFEKELWLPLFNWASAQPSPPPEKQR